MSFHKKFKFQDRGESKMTSNMPKKQAVDAFDNLQETMYKHQRRVVKSCKIL